MWLDLELLLHVVAHGEGFVAREHAAHKRLVELDDLRHLGFDRRKIFFAQFVLKLEVVIKAPVDGWPEGELHAGPQSHHRTEP